MSTTTTTSPSPSEVEAAFRWIEREAAERVAAVMAGTLDPETLPGVARWVDQCWHKPRRVDLVMAALDELTEGHGVEPIDDQAAWDHYYGSTVALYVNQGDTYAATIVYDIDAGSFELTTWGDWIEAHEGYSE